MIVALVAIVAIMALNCVAMVQGIDGAVLSTSFVIIGGLGGYQIKTWRDRKKS